MKNTFTKIAILVLSLALLACIPFAVSAEETSGEVEILAQNVIYNDTVSIVYAVDATIEDAKAGNVKVAYYWEDDETVYDAVLLDTTVADNLYNGHPCFATTGVAPKALGKVAYATVYTGDAPAADAVWKSYSVAEYLYARLYKNGFVNKTEADGKDYNRKLLYQNLLEYAAQAQLLFDYNADELVNDLPAAYTTHEDVTINGGKFVFNVATVEPTYTGSASCVGWIATDLEGNETEYPKAAFAVDDVISITPKIEIHVCADDNKDHKCDKCSEKVTECVTDANNDGKCDVCALYSFSASIDSYGTANGITVNNVGWNGTANQADSFSVVDTLSTAGRPTNFGKGYWFSLVANPTDAADRVIQYNMNSTNINWDTNGEFNSDSYLLFTPTEQVADGDLIVFQFDYWQNGGNTGKNPLLYYEAFANNATSTGNKVTYTWNADTNGDTTKETGVRPAQASSDIKDMTGWVPYQTWFTIRVVYSNTAHKSYYYVSTDGGATFDYLKSVTYAQESDLTQVGFYAEYVWQCGATMYIDNVLCVKTTEAAFGIDLP